MGNKGNHKDKKKKLTKKELKKLNHEKLVNKKSKDVVLDENKKAA
jgi:hypothetical protein